MAHKMAIESDLIRADMVEAIEFPHLAVKYHVHGVPKTVVNETFFIEGAMPEVLFVQQIVKAVK